MTIQALVLLFAFHTSFSHISLSHVLTVSLFSFLTACLCSPLSCIPFWYLSFAFPCSTRLVPPAVSMPRALSCPLGWTIIVLQSGFPQPTLLRSLNKLPQDPASYCSEKKLMPTLFPLIIHFCTIYLHHFPKGHRFYQLMAPTAKSALSFHIIGYSFIVHKQLSWLNTSLDILPAKIALNTSQKSPGLPEPHSRCWSGSTPAWEPEFETREFIWLFKEGITSSLILDISFVISSL